MRSPPITVKCDCGEVRLVAYGSVWECEACGRRWNTGQIPAAEYWGILHEMRAYRLKLITVALGFVVVVVPLGIFLSPSFFLLLPVVLGIWFIWFMPTWRKKLRRRARDLPRWNLYPD